MSGILFAPGITHYEYPIKRKGDHKMSEDGMTERERESGCTIPDVGPMATRSCDPMVQVGTPATGTDSKIHNPDKFLAQDAANEFKTLFFRDGNYSEEAIVISFISVVGEILWQNSIYSFYIFQPGDPEKCLEMEYSDKISAINDREKLLFQIEQYHSRGI